MLKMLLKKLALGKLAQVLKRKLGMDWVPEDTRPQVSFNEESRDNTHRHAHRHAHQKDDQGAVTQDGTAGKKSTGSGSTGAPP